MSEPSVPSQSADEAPAPSSSTAMAANEAPAPAPAPAPALGPRKIAPLRNRRNPTPSVPTSNFDFPPPINATQSSTNNVAAPESMAAGSRAEYERKAAEDTKIKADYHDKLADRDAEIAKLIEEREAHTKSQTNLRDEIKRLKEEKKEAEKRASDDEVKIKKAYDSRDAAKNSYAHLEEENKKQAQLIRNLDGRLDRAKIDLNVAQQQPKGVPTWDRVQTLEQELFKTATREKAAAAEMESARAELQTMFTEEQDLSLMDLVERTKTEHEHNRMLKRERSLDSLFSGGSWFHDEEPIITRPKHQRLVSGASLKDEMDDTGYASDASEASQEPILSGQDDEKKEGTTPPAPTEINTIRPARPGRGPVLEDTLTSPPQAPPAEPIQNEVKTYTVVAPPPTTFWGMWSSLPASARILYLVTFGLMMFMMLLLGRERNLWTTANDLRTTHNLIMGLSSNGVSGWNPLVSFFSFADSHMGLQHSLLG